MRDGIVLTGLTLTMWLACYGLVSFISDLLGIWPGCA